MSAAQSNQKDLLGIFEFLNHNNSRLASNIVKLDAKLREIKFMPVAHDTKVPEKGDIPTNEDFVSRSLVELREIDESIKLLERLLDHLDTLI